MKRDLCTPQAVVGGLAVAAAVLLVRMLDANGSGATDYVRPRRDRETGRALCGYATVHSGRIPTAR